MRWNIVLSCIALAACGEGDSTPENAVATHQLTIPQDPGQNGRKAVDPGEIGGKAGDAGEVSDSPVSGDLLSIDEQLNRLRSSSVMGARVISSRTQSLKLKLSQGGKAAFKPIRKGDRGAPREVAVFRLAERLGVGTVPVSTMRTLPLRLLVGLIVRRFPIEAAALQKKARTDEKGRVTGAIIQWVEGLDPSHLRSRGGRAGLAQWLAPARPGGDDPPLAASVAAMIAFDYVTGNWDRFSGGNVFVKESGDGTVLLDHNSTFTPWSKRQKKRMESSLRDTERFPAGLIKELSSLNAGNVESVLAEEPWHEKHRLLTTHEVNLMLKRRDKLIAHVDRLIELHGKESVLAFR